MLFLWLFFVLPGLGCSSVDSPDQEIRSPEGVLACKSSVSSLVCEQVHNYLCGVCVLDEWTTWGGGINR